MRHQWFAAALFLFFTQISMAERIEENPCLADIKSSISRLAQNSSYKFTLKTNGKVPGRFYTQDALAMFGLDNHFQGIQRVGNTGFALLTGGVRWTHDAHLFVLEGDHFSRRIDLVDKNRWHAGGLSQLGDIAAIPFDPTITAVTSRIVFWDFSNPKSPQQIPVEVIHKGGGSAVSLERLADGRFALAITSGGTIDIYYSKSQHFEDGFTQTPVHWSRPLGFEFGGQSVQLARQCDGQFFYLTFDNDGLVPPVLNGKDWVTLYRIDGLTGNSSDKISLEEVSRTRLKCDGSCNFAAAAGAYFGSDHKLRIYSTQFYRNWIGSQVRATEFAE